MIARCGECGAIIGFCLCAVRRREQEEAVGRRQTVLRRGAEQGEYRVVVDGVERGVVYRLQMRSLFGRAGSHRSVTGWSYVGADEAWNTRAEAVEGLLRSSDHASPDTPLPPSRR